jgi:hypothetical protein
MREINIVVTPDYADNAATSADPLALALREGARPPVWIDPMLDEIAAFLVASRSTGTPVLRPSTPLEALAALADTRSPPRLVQLSFADAKAPGMDGEDAAVAATDIIDAGALFINSLRMLLRRVSCTHHCAHASHAGSLLA